MAAWSNRDFPDMQQIDTYSSSADEDSNSDSDLTSPGDPGFEVDYGIRRPLRWILLNVPLTLFLVNRAAYRPAAYLSWVAAVWLTRTVALEALVLPPLVAGAIAPLHNSRVVLNMALVLATSPYGALAAFIWLWFVDRQWLWTPLALQAALRATAAFAQSSVPFSEAAIISVGVINVILADGAGEWRELLLCGLGGLVLCLPLLWSHSQTFRRSRGRSYSATVVGLVYLVYFGTAGWLYFGYCGRSQAWILGILQENYMLIAWWCFCLSLASLIAFFYSEKLTLDGRRKLWHLCSVALFLPAAQYQFTSMSLAVALVLFTLLETSRALALPPLGLWVHRKLQAFVDERDKCGPVVISHLYLLIGISGPIFTSQSPAGIVGLGVGDTVASLVGRRYGRIKLFGQKSLEGTLAFAIAVCILLHWVLEYSLSRAVLVGTATGLMEAVGSLNDNLVVPMYFLALSQL